MLIYITLKKYSIFSTRFGGRVPRSGSEQQLPRAETHSDFGRHSLLRSSLKASAAGPGGSGQTYQ